MRKYLVAIFFACSLMVVGHYLQQKNTPKDTWKIVPNPSSLKGKDQYDVIIIGGGFGGLSCGALLAKNGYKVLLCEKNATVGGLCSKYRTDDGFTFDYGAESILGLGESGALTYLMRELKLQKDVFFVLNSSRFVDKEATLNIARGPDSFQEALLKRYPSEQTGINSFFTMAKLVYHEAYDAEMIARWGIILPYEISTRVMSSEWIRLYPETHSHLLEWKEKSYQQVIDEYIVNPDVKLALSGFVSYLGKRPIEVRASDVVVGAYDGYFSGSFHALGTPEKFAQALVTYIEEHNGTVLTGSYVDKVDFSNGAVCGIWVGGKEYWTHVVVSDIDVRLLFSDLIVRGKRAETYLKELHSMSYGRSALCIHLAVKDPLKEYPSLVQSRDNSTFLSIPSKYDSDLAPTDCSTVVVRELVNLADFIGLGTENLDKYVEDRVARLMEHAIAIVPELKDSATIVKVVTPETYESLANIPNGAIFGFDGGKSVDRPYFKTPFKGLYLVSASSQRGPGVHEVISNGILCAHDIMDWQQ